MHIHNKVTRHLHKPQNTIRVGGEKSQEPKDLCVNWYVCVGKAEEREWANGFKNRKTTKYSNRNKKRAVQQAFTGKVQ